MPKITDRYEINNNIENIDGDVFRDLIQHTEMLRLTCVMLIDFIKEVAIIGLHDRSDCEYIGEDARKLLKDLGEIE